ncbi:MAG: MBL fold metallo-hydrolase [Meiothermus sp.]|nr:MBL fold metallo-hydrolase [Meiothermus sp.]
MTVHLLNTGYCTAHEHMVLRGGRRATIRAHALAALIEHPGGWVLFDTGYAPRVLDAFNIWPYRVYGWLTPTFLFQPVIAQLPQFGLAASDVSTVILSHLHADHVGGVLDFPEAKLVASRSAWQHARGKTDFSALRQGFIPLLMPGDFEQRATLIDRFDGEALPHLGATHDLLGDGTLRLVQLPGHARGQIGLLVNNEVLLAADGCWHSRAFRENLPPSPIPLNLFFDDAQASLQTLANLHHLHKTRPDLQIIPTHCPEVASKLTPSPLSGGGPGRGVV